MRYTLQTVGCIIGACVASFMYFFALKKFFRSKKNTFDEEKLIEECIKGLAFAAVIMLIFTSISWLF